jgi:general secretion pathway protein K
MVSLLKDNGGVALILTILIISLIVAVTLQFNTAMRSDLHAAVNLRDGIELGCIARSGFQCALAVLYEDADENEFDSLHETWAYTKALSSYSASIFEGGRFVVEITDLSGRIQLNRLVKWSRDDGTWIYDEKQKQLLKRFLSSEEFDLEPEDVDDIIDSIKDWIDPDDYQTEFGAENSYYQSLEPAYSCRNGPFRELEELLLVKGITKELFYGTMEKPGISKYLSVYGDGRININTADPLVLASLSDEIDEERAQEMVAYREDEENDLSKIRWYKTALGTTEDLIDPQVITTESTHFEIHSEGFKETISKLVTGTVERKRKEKTLTILSWKTQ